MSTHLLRVQTKVELLKRAMQQVAKFDPNQPRDFHGRWSDSGAGGAPAGPSSRVRIEPIRDRAHYEQVIHGIADKLGFDKKKIKLASPTASALFWKPLFAAMGQKGLPMAMHNGYTGKITVFEEVQGFNRKMVEGVIAHEITHAKFQDFYNTAVREKWRFQADNRKAPRARTLAEIHSRLVPDPQKYPTMSTWVGLVDNNWKRLVKDDGVTPYSKDFWSFVTSHALVVDRQGVGRLVPHTSGARQEDKLLAIEETITEMARIKQQSGKLPGSKVWRDLYNAIDAHWKASK